MTSYMVTKLKMTIEKYGWILPASSLEEAKKIIEDTTKGKLSEKNFNSWLNEIFYIGNKQFAYVISIEEAISSMKDNREQKKCLGLFAKAIKKLQKSKDGSGIRVLGAQLGIKEADTK